VYTNDQEGVEELKNDLILSYDGESSKEIEEIIEFCDPRIQAIKESIESAFGVSIDSHTLYFYGICEDCLKELRS